MEMSRSVCVLGREVTALQTCINYREILVIREFSVSLGKLGKIRVLGMSSVGICVCARVCVYLWLLGRLPAILPWERMALF